jgi:alkylated DNA repair dioxygenase AlkB
MVGLGGLRVYRGWRTGADLMVRLRRLVVYSPGDDRATGYLYSDGEQDWPAELAGAGQALLTALKHTLGTAFPIVAFQAYRNGSGCDWHADTAFDEHAVLSLGTTRTFGVREVGGEPEWIPVGHGDLVYMPSGFQSTYEHCVPAEDATGERISLVFRTRARS